MDWKCSRSSSSSVTGCDRKQTSPIAIACSIRSRCPSDGTSSSSCGTRSTGTDSCTAPTGDRFYVFREKIPARIPFTDGGLSNFWTTSQESSNCPATDSSCRTCACLAIGNSSSRVASAATVRSGSESTTANRRQLGAGREAIKYSTFSARGPRYYCLFFIVASVHS